MPSRALADGPLGRPDMAYFGFTQSVLAGKRITEFRKDDGEELQSAGAPLLLRNDATRAPPPRRAGRGSALPT